MATTDIPPHGDMVRRLAVILESASDGEWQEGTFWYASAHSAAAAMAVKYQTTYRHACGVIAALSPRLPWARNIMYAAMVFETGKAPVLKGNLEKAQAIAAGAEPLDVLRGKKVTAFYGCLVAPGLGDDVAVDRHAVDAAVGCRGDDASRKRILESASGYEAVSAAYREAAALFGIAPAQCQAIVWCYWRNVHGIATR